MNNDDNLLENVCIFYTKEQNIGYMKSNQAPTNISFNEQNKV